jgi:hypothetical protein
VKFKSKPIRRNFNLSLNRRISMSQNPMGSSSKKTKIIGYLLFLLALFCFFNAQAVRAENALDGKFLNTWIKGNGKQINDNNGQLQLAKLKKKDYVIQVKLEAYDCDTGDTTDFTQNDCGGYCYAITSLKFDSGSCEEEDIGDLYTCGGDEKTGSAIISTFNDPNSFEAAFITQQVFTKDGTLKKLESKAGSGKIDDEDTSIEPDAVLKNVLLKATEIAEDELDCTP